MVKVMCFDGVVLQFLILLGTVLCGGTGDYESGNFCKRNSVRPLLHVYGATDQVSEYHREGDQLNAARGGAGQTFDIVHSER